MAAVAADDLLNTSLISDLAVFILSSSCSSVSALQHPSIAGLFKIYLLKRLTTMPAVNGTSDSVNQEGTIIITIGGACV